MKSYYSNGKLLLTGEYLVLDGGLSLALPTKFGQHLYVEAISESKIEWVSLDEQNHIWFETEFEIENNSISNNNDNPTSNRLFDILKTAQKLNSRFIHSNHGFKITTVLEFPKNWGLGTSSTLINNIANWAEIDAFELLKLTFGGSGYDIACAQHDTAISYQLNPNFNAPLINPIVFNPNFKEHLYFVYLNRKQDSREGISHYKNNAQNLDEAKVEINQITQDLIICNSLDEFNSHIDKHEQIISKLINQKPIKDRLFRDFNGSIKSLGAWGGDFVLVTSKIDPTNYFKNKGFETILRFKEMIKI